MDYPHTIDFYTPNIPGLSWNFCFLMADASGDYGLVEIAENKIHFIDKQPAQANFYITEDLAEKEEFQCGRGSIL